MKPKLIARASGNTSPWQMNKNAPKVSANEVPEAVRPLMSYALWRAYENVISRNDPVTPVLLTNDLNAINIAQKFNIKAQDWKRFNENISLHRWSEDKRDFIGDLEHDLQMKETKLPPLSKNGLDVEREVAGSQISVSGSLPEEIEANRTEHEELPSQNKQQVELSQIPRNADDIITPDVDSGEKEIVDNSRDSIIGETPLVEMSFVEKPPFIAEKDVLLRESNLETITGAPLLEGAVDILAKTDVNDQGINNQEIIQNRASNTDFKSYANVAAIKVNSGIPNGKAKRHPVVSEGKLSTHSTWEVQNGAKPKGINAHSLSEVGDHTTPKESNGLQVNGEIMQNVVHKPLEEQSFPQHPILDLVAKESGNSILPISTLFSQRPKVASRNITPEMQNEFQMNGNIPHRASFPFEREANSDQKSRRRDNQASVRGKASDVSSSSAAETSLDNFGLNVHDKVKTEFNSVQGDYVHQEESTAYPEAHQALQSPISFIRQVDLDQPSSSTQLSNVSCLTPIKPIEEPEDSDEEVVVFNPRAKRLSAKQTTSVKIPEAPPAAPYPNSEVEEAPQNFSDPQGVPQRVPQNTKMEGSFKGANSHFRSKPMKNSHSSTTHHKSSNSKPGDTVQVRTSQSNPKLTEAPQPQRQARTFHSRTRTPPTIIDPDFFGRSTTVNMRPNIPNGSSRHSPRGSPGRGTRIAQMEVDYVLRSGSSRETTRGRGQLWVP